MSSNSLRSVQILTYDGQSARLALAPPRTRSLNLLPTLGRPYACLQAAAIPYRRRRQAMQKFDKVTDEAFELSECPQRLMLNELRELHREVNPPAPQASSPRRYLNVSSQLR